MKSSLRVAPARQDGRGQDEGDRDERAERAEPGHAGAVADMIGVRDEGDRDRDGQREDRRPHELALAVPSVVMSLCGGDRRLRAVGVAA